MNWWLSFFFLAVASASKCAEWHWHNSSKSSCWPWRRRRRRRRTKKELRARSISSMSVHATCTGYRVPVAMIITRWFVAFHYRSPRRFPFCFLIIPSWKFFIVGIIKLFISLLLLRSLFLSSSLSIVSARSCAGMRLQLTFDSQLLRY